MKNKIILTDTFNNYVISTHRTVKAAFAARDAYSRMLKRVNGPHSYTMMSITSADGKDITDALLALW